MRGLLGAAVQLLHAIVVLGLLWENVLTNDNILLLDGKVKL